MSTGLPLEGRRVVVTRPAHQQEALAAPLRAMGAEVVSCPMLEIAAPSDSGPLLRAAQETHFDRVLVLSANGARAWARVAGDIQKKFATVAVGAATRTTLAENGIAAEVVAGAHSARELLAALRGEVAGQRILVVRAEDNDGVLAEGLEAAGAAVVSVAAYRGILPEDAEALVRAAFALAPAIDAVTFASGRAAEHFYEVLRRNALVLPPGAVTVSIGAETTAVLRRLGHAPDAEAASRSAESLAEAVCAALAAGRN